MVRARDPLSSRTCVRVVEKLTNTSFEDGKVDRVVEMDRVREI